MIFQSSARLQVAISFSCYAVGAPLIAHFVSPAGLGGLLGAYPLYTVTWLWGKKRGLVAAAIAAGLNFVIWFIAGNGKQTASGSGAAHVIVLLLAECLAYAMLVLIVSAMKRREGRIQDEIERSKDLLRVSEVKYRNLIEAAPEAISVVENGKVIFCNTHLLEMLGYSREELMGMEIARIIHEDDAGWVMECYETHGKGELVPKTIFRDRRKNGAVIWVESVGQWIEWEGRPAVLYFTSDITERKRAGDALQESEERYRISESKYRNLIEVAPEAISVVENGKVIFCNSQGLDMLGYAQEEMIGMDFTRLLHKDNVAEAVQRYWARTEGDSVSQSTLCLMKKDGQPIWVKSVGKLIDWEGRRAVLNFTSDVTEKKKLEEQFAQAQKMEAIGRLAGGIAHDFNNMLQVILGYCSMLKSYPEDKNAVLNDARVIEEAAQRAASLTQQLLAFSRKQMVQPRVVDVRGLVGQSEKMLSRVLGEDIVLKVVLGDEASRVKADTAQIQQVIMNLALNARDAMPAGGTITISVDCVALMEAGGQEKVSRSYVRLTVSDTGQGMDGSVMDHLFEPFFTTKGLGKGTGLGLSIVYGTVKQCGGFINAESRVGAGSTFTIHLPRVFEPTDDRSARAEEESRCGTGSILLVEDEASVRGLLKKILEGGGYAVTEAECGEKAITICRAHEKGFDLLITDLVLTGMSGGEAADYITHLFPRTQVIYISGYADKGDEPRQKGAPIIQKPFSSVQLLAQVKKALRPGTFPSAM